MTERPIQQLKAQLERLYDLQEADEYTSAKFAALRAKIDEVELELREAYFRGQNAK